MASTKYRKKEKSDPALEAKKLPEPKKEEIPLDSPPIKKVVENFNPEHFNPTKVKENTSFIQEESEQETSNEDILDHINIEDEKNLFEIKLLKKANRLTRVAFFLNDIEIRPHTYAGNNAGSSYFQLLKMTRKKGG